MTSTIFQQFLAVCLLILSATLSSAQALAPPQTPLPNWAYEGCYTDAVGQRILNQNGFTSGSLTNTQCIQFCIANGYNYAGTEYAGECYCGNSLANGATRQKDSDCNMSCNGNATEPCGGPNRLTVFNTALPSAPTGPFVNPGVNGFQSLGCYVDSVNVRTLATGVTTTGGAQLLTVALCTSACSTGGYTYAGVEYAGECYCANTLGTNARPTDASGCNMICSGNSTEYCGGPNRINVYQWSNTASSSSSAAGTLTAPPVTQTPTQLSALVTTITTSVVGGATSIPAGWNYKGCWVDNYNGRIMVGEQIDNNRLTIESCIATCSGLGYTVAGMEFSVECFCDSFLRAAAISVPDTDCSMPCGGDHNEKCGAGNRLSVYSNSTNALTVYPIPSVQKTNLAGSWQYSGCIRDDAQTRALPYRIMMNYNNTPNNCISQCSAFGYSAGGMEYGNECYCGDPGDVAAAGVGAAPETDCAFGCSGDIATICGGASRLSYYIWNGPPLTQFSYLTGNAAGAYQFLVGGVVVPLITQAARNGKVTFLEKSGTGPPNSTGAYELDLAQINNFTGAWRPMHVKTDIFCSSSLTLPDSGARQINIGGWALDSTFGIRLYWPDGKPGVWGSNDWHENRNEVALQAGRWYPSSMIMANGTVLVVGGEQGPNSIPSPSLEILPRSGPIVFCSWLNRTDPNNLFPFLAVLPSGGIFVQYYNEAIILDENTFAVTKQLPNAPGAVNNFNAGRTYPMQGTAVLLPQYPPYTDPLKIMVCGGSTPYQGLALDNCITIAPEVPGARWTIERMPSKRVLTCMTSLPDGTYMIINGAQQGFGGFGLASNPNYNALLYDPSKPVNTRFSVMANTTIARLYHSEAILLDDARVLVTGSDPEDNRYPQEYRIEVFIPPYLMGNPVRPIVTMAEDQKDWAYGGPYTFTVSQAISKISILSAGSSTHGNSMGQRTIFLNFNCNGSTCTATAPPNAHVCPPGWFQFFALNANGVPSTAMWVRVGGDPANLGAWPKFPDFRVPNPPR